MSEITNIDGLRSAAPRASGHPAAAVPETRRGTEVQSTPQDRVELSELGTLLAAARDLPDIRIEKVIAAREQILAGTYETPDKIAITVNRLLEDLAG
jgi:hypothetical protein